MRRIDDLPNGYNGEPVGAIALVVFMCALPFIVSAWQVESTHGVLVGEMTRGTKAVRFFTKIALPLREDDYRLFFEFKTDGDQCELAGELEIEELSSEMDCAGTKGKGTVSCANGSPLDVLWAMTSCTTGGGKSMGKESSALHFAYAHNKESAIDELARIVSSRH